MKSHWISLTIVYLLCIFPTTLWALDDEPRSNENSELAATLGFSEILPEDFQGLLTLRKKVSIRQATLESEIRKLRADLQLLPKSVDVINIDIENLKKRIDNDKKTVEELEKSNILNDEERARLDTFRQYIQDDESSIKRFTLDKTNLINTKNKISRTGQSLLLIESYLAPIEQKIADLLNIEEERNDFRKLISFAFCGLVAIVIIGFYYIAVKNIAIAESIFSGEKGVQFVTIFLIVIAIILFGIMGILESKELSALLGGLSGYILGRAGKATT